MATRFVPNGDRILVKLAPVGDEKTAGGLYMPGSSSSRGPKMATVVAVPDRLCTELQVKLAQTAADNIPASEFDDSMAWIVPFNVGDNVLVDDLSYMEISVEGEKLVLIRHQDILGRFETVTETAV